MLGCSACSTIGDARNAAEQPRVSSARSIRASSRRLGATTGRLRGSHVGGLVRLHSPRHDTEDGRVRYGPVVDRLAVDHGHRICEAVAPDRRDEVRVRDRDGLLGDIVVSDARDAAAEAALDLCGNDRGDLLRRPGRASTAAEAGGLGGKVEHLDGDQGVAHLVGLSIRRQDIGVYRPGHGGVDRSIPTGVSIRKERPPCGAPPPRPALPLR